MPSIAEQRDALTANPMGKEALAAHMAKCFPDPKAPTFSKDSIFPIIAEPVSVPPAAALFTLTPDDTIAPVNGKGKGKARKARTSQAKALNEVPPTPTCLVEYEAELANGTPISVPEYAHLVKVDGETLLLAFPISSRSRLRPLRSASIQIKTGQGIFDAFCTGIHMDIPEWSMSVSIYLIRERL